MQLLYVDPLTKVYNRRYFKEYIRDISEIKAVALIDVDGLKQINDDYGREAGDLVLQRTAQMLLSLIRRNDHLIRYGGDEFLIGFNSMAKHAFGARLEEIRKSLDALTVDKYPRLHMSVSVVGIYGTGKPEELFNMAGNMLNESGKAQNKVTLYFPDDNQGSAGSI